MRLILLINYSKIWFKVNYIILKDIKFEFNYDN